MVLKIILERCRKGVVLRCLCVGLAVVVIADELTQEGGRDTDFRDCWFAKVLRQRIISNK